MFFCERRKRYLHALSTSRRQSAVNEKLEDVKTIEEASRIEENRKKNAQIEAQRNKRNAINARRERERQFNSQVMAVSSAALGLLGPAGFPFLMLALQHYLVGQWLEQLQDSQLL